MNKLRKIIQTLFIGFSKHFTILVSLLQGFLSNYIQCHSSLKVFQSRRTENKILFDLELPINMFPSALTIDGAGKKSRVVTPNITSVPGFDFKLQLCQHHISLHHIRRKLHLSFQDSPLISHKTCRRDRR